MRYRTTLPLLGLLAGVAPALAQEAEVIHWWTSEGESKAARVLAEAFEASGGTWVDNAIAGASAARQASFTRIVAGDPPEASQFNSGREFEDLAAQGLLTDISAVAQEGNWGQTVPQALLASAQIDGKVFAMPMNIHGRNWIWFNAKLLEEVGAEVPTGWGEDMFVALDKLKSAGKVPLALSGTPSYELSLFESILLDIGGANLWYGLYQHKAPEAFASAELRQAFETYSRLRDYVDVGSPGRTWNAATNMVITGEAGFTSLGDWAKAEFAAAGQTAGVDYGCILPDGVLQIGGDVFVFPKLSDDDAIKAQQLLIETLADNTTLRNFNAAKGSIPPRADVDMTGTDVCAEKGSEALQLSDTNVPRLTMLQPSSVAGEIQDLISQFWNDPSLDIETAIARYTEIVLNG